MGLPQNRIFLTGASGFVGSHLNKYLQEAGFKVRELRRLQIGQKPGVGDLVHFDGFESEFDLRQPLMGCDVVIHCAGMAHSMDYVLADYRCVNVSATLALAKQASDAGVKRFVYVSTIKVNGENSRLDHPFADSDTPAAIDPYSVSKLEAELALRQLSKETGLEIVIVRPPLVYGPGVKGNFRSLLSLAGSGLPLPLGAVCNKRSLIYVGNLVEFMALCATHPAARNQIFLVSDGHDISTAELLRHLRKEMHMTARLFPVPSVVLSLVGRLLGKSALIERLCGSLQVDCSKAMSMLGWHPSYSVDVGLKATVGDYLTQRGNP